MVEVCRRVKTSQLFVRRDGGGIERIVLGDRMAKRHNGRTIHAHMPSEELRNMGGYKECFYKLVAAQFVANLGEPMRCIPARDGGRIAHVVRRIRSWPRARLVRIQQAGVRSCQRRIGIAVLGFFAVQCRIPRGVSLSCCYEVNYRFEFR